MKKLLVNLLVDLSNKINDTWSNIKSEINSSKYGYAFINKKGNIRKVYKISALIITGMIIHSSISSDIDLKKYNSTVEEYEYKITTYKDKLEDKSEEINDVETEKNNIQLKYDELSKTTHEYTSLTDEEKVLVDVKIQEVKQATQAQLEAEQKAREEAEAKKKAEEEAAKKAEEERIAAEQAAKEQAKKEYTNAKNFIQTSVAASGYNFVVDLSVNTITISLDTGDITVSDLRKSYSDEFIIANCGVESVYESTKNLAISCYNEVTSLYNVPELEIKATMKFGGEKMCTFNQYGECEYTIFD